MAEYVYRPVIGAALTMFRALDIKFELQGTEHVPTSGGAVVAANHVSYLDFMFVGLAAKPQGRLVRFMAKQSVFDHKVSGPLMRGMKHIPVDRSAGASAYLAAVDALRGGELVGVFPESTISRSFVPRAFKSGAARMAQEAGVPILPVVTWGGQRIWTTGRKPTWTRHVPIVVAVGEPIAPDAAPTPDSLTEVLRERLTADVDRVQRAYTDAPSGAGAWWHPVHLGGDAPTPERAAELEAEAIARRAAARERA